MQNNTNRWYDASVGRWISPDPTGFAAGDTNECRYVGNSPANATDPRGLAGEGKAFKEIVRELIKAGVERKLYRIHHIIGHALFKDVRFAKFLREIGIGKNLAKNLIALPAKNAKAALAEIGSGLAKAASHTGRHIIEYVEALAKKLATIREEYLAAMKAANAAASEEAKKAAKEAARDAAAKAVQVTQDAIRKGLEDGTIALQREEAEALAKGGVLSYGGGLIVLGNPAEIEDLKEKLAKQQLEDEVHEAIAPFTAANLLGEDSWSGWAIDLFNGASDLEAILDIAIMITPPQPKAEPFRLIYGYY